MSALVVIPADELRAMLQTAVRDGVRDAMAQLGPQLGEDRDRLVGVEEAAGRLGLSTSTIYKRAERCELPSVKAGSRVLFRVADLDAYAEQRRRSPERVRQLAERVKRGQNVIRNVTDDQRPQAEIDRASLKRQ